MEKDIVTKVRENIACPQFGDKEYGSWGALPFRIRLEIYNLVRCAEVNRKMCRLLEGKIVELQNKNDERLDKYLDLVSNKFGADIDLYNTDKKIKDLKTNLENEMNKKLAQQKRVNNIKVILILIIAILLNIIL